MAYQPGQPTLEALTTGRTVVTPGETSEFDFAAVAPTPESAAFARQVGLHSAITVPLVARGQNLGVLSFALSASPRRFGPDEIALAARLASRAAVAIDSALLFRKEQRSGRR